ncbi:transcriptional repressor TraM [Rhizobium calliandrae]|uniref:Transcriptional repressor TraM n=1 Tax=Rhizobium calliandrae TaxID=1312182 RepID=A0ABT7KFM1_9HYPH|nr:transcriptional repressor TraM [Rhizobium calliandrae]MDL2406148.1 transcriptional repressor TraM [Rhizobium calliandrae]
MSKGNRLRIGPDQETSEAKLILRPLIGLMSGLSPDEIERYCLTELEKHRRLREEAVRLEAEAASADDVEERARRSRAFVSAMIAVHAQQTVVSTLLDILGHIPDTSAIRAH